MNPESCTIIGGGPAGLSAAIELLELNITPTVLERSKAVGGISRTEVFRGYRFDIGGHRFFTKVSEIHQLWEGLLGENFIRVPRLSRIYYAGRFFDYPVSFHNALSNFGLWDSLLVGLSYLRAHLRPSLPETTLEEWMVNRFGRRLYEMFFKDYTEKVWGIPSSRIRADWASQRIQGLSLFSTVVNAIFGSNGSKTLIRDFEYPVLGPGMLWERAVDRIEQRGGTVTLNADVTSIRREGRRITHVTTGAEDSLREWPVDAVISSMAVDELIERLTPPPPTEVLAAARGLKYRAFIIVGLIVEGSDLFPDNWIYVHDTSVRVGRIQNFRNWSQALVPEQGKTGLGMEYFCNVGDDVWCAPDETLVDLATRELEQLSLACSDQVEAGVVFREPKAYPIYDLDFERCLNVVRGYLDSLENLQTVGRNGMHRYNNMDHSMLTGMLAARNLGGASYDLWTVNTERFHHEELPSE